MRLLSTVATALFIGFCILSFAPATLGLTLGSGLFGAGLYGFCTETLI